MDGYDATFMAAGVVGADRNVAAVLPLVVEELGFRPKTAVDVGCGAGAWVRELAAAGIDAVGWDGPWAAATLVVPSDRFKPWNLEEALPLEQRFDLAVTIEVAEHLSPLRGPSFVADLCALADAVLFSAALPGQPGTHHINLRWQSYWIGLFSEQGYGVIDCVRPALWAVPPGVAWVLAQQCFLFVRGRAPKVAMPLDVVHPGMHHELTYARGVRQLVADLPGAFLRSARHHGRRLSA